MAYRYGHSPSEAEDIAQEALLRAFRAKHTLRDPERRDAWLASIVRHEAWRYYSRPQMTSIELIDEIDGVEDEGVLATVERADLREALDQLSERDRIVLDLRYDKDLTQMAIARRLGVPENTAKVWLHRARARLKRHYVPA